MDDLLELPIFKIVSEVADEMGVECYVIGGFVRDIFLEREQDDIDVVVLGNGNDFAHKVAKSIGGIEVSHFKNFGTAMFRYDNFEVEFVGARKESYNYNSRKPVVEEGTLEDDQKRRDFTINALAINLNKGHFGEILDPFGGIQDLKNKIIKTPLDPDITFSDDPLRMFRAIRFAAQLNFIIEEKTYESIKRNAQRVSILSGERIVEELMKIMKTRVPSKGLKMLQETGIMEIILPEISALQGTQYVDGKGHKDNFLHTMEVVDKISANSNNVWLRWTALFHDIGKPQTKRFDEKVGWTFHAHDYVGAKMMFAIFKRLKFPLDDRLKYIKKLISLHLRPIALVDDGVTDSAVRRLLFDAGDEIEDLMLLCEADVTSKNPAKVKRILAQFENVRTKLIEVEEKDKLRNWQPPISGEMIMQTFNLSPSREVGVIKDAIRDAILDCKIDNNFDEAYKYMLQEAEKLGIVPVQ